MTSPYIIYNILATSPELTGGAGFTFEDKVSTTYLTSLLAECTSSGLAGGLVQRFSLQQAPEEPLDDIVVDARSTNGETFRLSLQVKRSLTISAAGSNIAFREIVINSWKTLKKDSFRLDNDRYGVATDDCAVSKFRRLDAICDWARCSDTAENFITRFNENGHASAYHKEIKDEIESLLIEAIGSKPSDDDLYQFFKHFLCIRFDSLHEGATNPPEQSLHIY